MNIVYTNADCGSKVKWVESAAFQNYEVSSDTDAVDSAALSFLLLL